MTLPAQVEILDRQRGTLPSGVPRNDNPTRPMNRLRAVAQRLTPAQEALIVLALTSGLQGLFQLIRAAHGTSRLLTLTGMVETIVWQCVIGFVLATMLGWRSWPLKELLSFRGSADVLATAGVLIATLVAVALTAGIIVGVPHASADVHPLFIQKLTGVAILADVGLVIVNPIFEELLWLGYWFRRFEGRSPALAWMVSLGLRCVAHLYKGLLGAATVLPLAAVFTAYYSRTKRLWPPIAVHAILDAIALFRLLHVAH
jgi:membrane protease YdiL (CAAX protease family)